MQSPSTMNIFESKNPFRATDSGAIEVLVPSSRDRSGESDVAGADNRWVPPVDILENRTAYLFKADLPGLKVGEVRVVRISETLVISGHRNLGYRQKPLRSERPHGYFIRRLPLPDNASREQIQASLSDGVLQIVVRKVPFGGREAGYPNDLEVNIN